MDRPPKQTRASRPKVRTGCITCKIRRVKCDETKPECLRCTNTGRKCDGYQAPASSTPSRQLIPATPASLPGEGRALEFFFHHTGPRLAGYFEGSFWTGIAMQLSLSEPAIRHALAAIGSLYEQEASITRSPAMDRAYPGRNLSLHLYSKSIQSVIEKMNDPTATPIVVMASILFASYEFLRADSTAASTHIANGINLLQRWRDNNESHSKQDPWPQRYSSFQSQFMETELAPILSLFSVNSSEFTPGPLNRIILNGMDDRGLVVIASEFETLREARVAFTDLVTATVAAFQRIDDGLKKGDLPNIDTVVLFRDMQSQINRWKDNFEVMCQKNQHSWSKKHRNAATALHLMWHSAMIGIRSYLVKSESDWDAFQADYEQIIELAESLLVDNMNGLNELSNALSLDFGFIFPLHGAAWKCRWPNLRRRALRLFKRVPRREWLLDAEQYHTIFTRIMEIEEAGMVVNHDPTPAPNALIPDIVRVYDFYCETVYPSPERRNQLAVTFITKPQGPDSPCHFQTEYISVRPSSSGSVALPSNLITCRRWAQPDMTDSDTAALLKSIMFGDYGCTLSLST